MPRSVAIWQGRTDDAMPGKLVRDRLSRAQGDCCALCRQPFGPKRRAHCDHIVPLIDGGQNCEANLQMICADCHKAKTSAEASARKKTRDIRESHIMARPASKWPTQRLGNGNNQHRATTPLIKRVGQFNEA